MITWSQNRHKFLRLIVDNFVIIMFCASDIVESSRLKILLLHIKLDVIYKYFIIIEEKLFDFEIY